MNGEGWWDGIDNQTANAKRVEQAAKLFNTRSRGLEDERCGDSPLNGKTYMYIAISSFQDMFEYQLVDFRGLQSVKEPLRGCRTGQVSWLAICGRLVITHLSRRSDVRYFHLKKNKQTMNPI